MKSRQSGRQRIVADSSTGEQEAGCDQPAK